MKSKKLARIAKITFILVVFYILWKVIDFDKMTGLLKHISIYYFGIVVLVCFLDKVMMGYKWNYLLKVFGIHVPFSAPIIANLRAKVFQLFTPTSIGEDVYKAFYIRQSGAALAPTVASIIVERFLGILSSLAVIMLLLHFPMIHFGIPHVKWISVAGIFGFFVLIGIMYALIRFSGRLNNFDSMSWMSAKIRDKIDRLLKPMSMISHDHRRVWIFYGLSILEKIAYGTAIYFAAAAIGPKELSYVYIISATPLLALLERLPISISAIGLREGMMVVLLSSYFQDPTIPVTISLTLRAAEMLMTILCLFLWIGRHDGDSYKERIKEIDIGISSLK